MENTMQSNSEVVVITQAWYQNHPTQEFLDPTKDSNNGNEFRRYIHRHFQGVYSPQNLDISYVALADRLHRKAVVKTPEQLLQEKQEAEKAQMLATVKKWLAEYCPLGIKTTDGVIGD